MHPSKCLRLHCKKGLSVYACGGEEFNMNNLIGRVKAILLTPTTEWPVIAAEPETTSGLYTKYILVLAALGPIAMFLKSTLIGTSVPFLGTFRLDMGTGLLQLVLTYGLSLVVVYIFALVINALAPTFGGQKDSVQALKASAYCMTAGWVAGIAQILPWIGWLIGLIGVVYGIYLLYLGLPHTMKAPQEKAAGYTAVCVIAVILLWWIVFSIIGGIVGRSMWGGMGAPARPSAAPAGSRTILPARPSSNGASRSKRRASRSSNRRSSRAACRMAQPSDSSSAQSPAARKAARRCRRIK